MAGPHPSVTGYIYVGKREELETTPTFPVGPQSETFTGDWKFREAVVGKKRMGLVWTWQGDICGTPRGKDVARSWKLRSSTQQTHVQASGKNEGRKREQERGRKRGSREGRKVERRKGRHPCPAHTAYVTIGTFTAFSVIPVLFAQLLVSPPEEPAEGRDHFPHICDSVLSPARTKLSHECVWVPQSLRVEDSKPCLRLICSSLCSLNLWLVTMKQDNWEPDGLGGKTQAPLQHQFSAG